MMSPFEERLLETLFPDFLAWSTECIATYVLHQPGKQRPIFFKKMTDDVLEVAMRHPADVAVYAVKTDGSVDDVTEAWQRVFEKHKSTRTAVDELIGTWAQKVPSHVATYEVKLDGATIGYFAKPTIEILRSTEKVHGIRRLTILAIHKTGTIEDVSAIWRPMFEEYLRIRYKNVSDI